MNMSVAKEKKNIVADPIYSELVGKSVNMSTVKGDYTDVMIHQYDQYTLIVEIEGSHFLLSKSAIIDIEIPNQSVNKILGNIDEAFKRIEYKKHNLPKKPAPTVQIKQRRHYNQSGE